MNDLRLWFVFFGIGALTIVALNPSDPLLATGPATVLPVTGVAFLAMLAARFAEEVRERTARQAGTAPRGSVPSARFLGFGFAAVMLLQAVAVLSSSGLPAWTGPWAFLGIALVTETMLLTLYEIVADAMAGRGRRT